MQPFRRLLVWQRAHALALDARRISRSFPRSGYSSLKSQLVRSAESIPSNIVEGCGAATNREFSRFLDIAIKSTSELEYHFQLAHDSGVLSTGHWQTLTTETVEIRRMLCGLRRRVLDATARRTVPRPGTDHRNPSSESPLVE
jgi:four helix bundle protein